MTKPNMTEADCKCAASMFIRSLELRLLAATQWREALQFVDADPELVKQARGAEIQIESFLEQAKAEFRDPSPERFYVTFRKGNKSWQ